MWCRESFCFLDLAIRFSLISRGNAIEVILSGARSVWITAGSIQDACLVFVQEGGKRDLLIDQGDKISKYGLYVT